MKKPETDLRKELLKVRVSEREKMRLKTLQKQTTERSLSNYVRKVVLQKPVIVLYRNKSADDFLKDMLALKKELAGIGDNFNQAVHKLHLLEKIPEFRLWIQQNDGLQKSLVGKVEEILSRVTQLYEQWSQK